MDINALYKWILKFNEAKIAEVFCKFFGKLTLSNYKKGLANVWWFEIY